MAYKRTGGSSWKNTVYEVLRKSLTSRLNSFLSRSSRLPQEVPALGCQQGKAFLRWQQAPNDWEPCTPATALLMATRCSSLFSGEDSKQNWQLWKNCKCYDEIFFEYFFGWGSNDREQGIEFHLPIESLSSIPLKAVFSIRVTIIWCCWGWIWATDLSMFFFSARISVKRSWCRVFLTTFWMPLALCFKPVSNLILQCLERRQVHSGITFPFNSSFIVRGTFLLVGSYNLCVFG